MKGRRGACSNQGVVKVLFCFSAFGVSLRTDLSSSVVALESLLVSETVAYYIHLFNQSHSNSLPSLLFTRLSL